MSQATRVNDLKVNVLLGHTNAISVNENEKLGAFLLPLKRYPYRNQCWRQSTQL